MKSGSSTTSTTPPGRLARLASAHAKLVLILAVAGVCVAAPIGLTAFDDLDPYEFEDSATESARAEQLIEEASGMRADLPVLVLIDASAKTEAGRDRIVELTEKLEGVEGIEAVISPLDGARSQVARDGSSVYLIGSVATSTDETLIEEGLVAAFEDDSDVTLGGSILADRQVSDQTEADLQRAELFAFPLLFILSLLFFRGLVAAALPLLLGALSLVGTLAVLRMLHEVLGIGVLSINVATGLGFGLAIDYSLFIVSRFREELAGGRDTDAALSRTLATAGRTVLYSSLTVACAMGGMLVFPQNFLYSMGIAGIAVALLSAFGALIVLPALLSLLGERVNALAPRRLQRSRSAVDQPDRDGTWYRLANWVMGHPVPVATLASIVLLLAAFPLTRVEFAADDASVLPVRQSAGALDQALADDFPPGALDAIVVALDAGTAAGIDSSQPEAYASNLAELPGVRSVEGPQRVSDQLSQILVISGVGRYSDATEDLARAVRATPFPAPRLVGGVTAADLDEVDSVKRHLPLAAMFLVATTLILLFLMTGSLVLPVKALVMNVLSLSAALGLVVVVFQGGSFDSLLDLRSPDGIQIGILVLIFFSGFGLSTDYGVFTFSRMREARLSGASNQEAVALGLERTGRIVTSAALLFAVAMGALVSGAVIGVKETGFGVAAAVLIDASLVRMFLVPALMAMLGDRNWWAPQSLLPLARFAEGERPQSSEAPS